MHATKLLEKKELKSVLLSYHSQKAHTQSKKISVLFINMFTQEKKCMGTQVEILIPKGKEYVEEKAKFHTEKCFELFEKYEQMFSRFRENSELSELNKKRKMQVSDDFFKLLDFAISLAKKTNGVFNPLVQLSALGYSHDFWSKTFIADKKEFSLDFEKIKMEKTKNIVELSEHAFLDLGGCAKGFTVDKTVKYLDSFFSHFLVNAGGDMFARGNFHGEPWIVAVADPNDEEKDALLLDAENNAIATSGSYRRKWKNGEKEYHHLVLGNTNTNNTSHYASVTVEAKNTLFADSYATIAFLLGKEKGDIFLKENEAKGYFLS